VLVDLIPGVSITHPARLVLPAQAVLCGLAGAALAGLGRRAWLLIPVVLVESALASAARWPVSTSGPAIPPVYARIATDGDPRGVLDLPPMVRRTMRTCVYFWYQTRHHHPIPWWPDVRTDHNGDVLLVRRFTPQPLTTVRNSGFTPLDAVAITELRARYGWVVVHTEFDQRTKGGGGSTDLLSAAFGPPETEGSLRIWRLPAIEGQNR
jgi:hypothetical protein